MSERLFQLAPAVGHFTSTDALVRNDEAVRSLSCASSFCLCWKWKLPATVRNSRCGHLDWERVYPAVVAREDGVLHDFADIVLHDHVVSEEVGRDLEAAFSGVRTSPLIVWDPHDPYRCLDAIDTSERHPAVDQHCNKAHRGPRPVELTFQMTIHIAETESTYERIGECPDCGRFYPKLTGIETVPSEVLIDDAWVMMPGRARQPRQGLLLRADAVRGLDFFATDSGLVIVREAVKAHIEAKAWRNVKFLEVGEVID